MNRLLARTTLLLVCAIAQAPRALGQTDNSADAPPGTAPPPQAQVQRELSPLLKQFTDVLQVVESHAADPPALDQAIYEGAIPAMLRPLDPHTQFFTQAQFDQLKQMESAEQKGFGSIVSVLPGRVLFLQTLPGTPSSRAGIMPGDELVAVNGVAIASLEPEQIVGLLTEARQRQAMLAVRRQGNAKLLRFAMTPALVDSPSVDRAFLLAPGIGYVRLASWDLETGRLFREAIERMGGPKLGGLVIDLRNNPGGIMQAALEGASLFLQPGQRILTARGRFGETQSANVVKTANPYRFPIAVLINGKTASASEIFAGALQDHDRATIVGETSYGKGLVQSVMPLSNGTGLALTTAYYYTPSGRSIQHALENTALAKIFDSTSQQARQTFRTDAGRVVEGGGGIKPDRLVRLTVPSRLEEVLDASGAVTTFATAYLAAHPASQDAPAVTPELLDEFKVYLSTHQIQPGVAEWSRELPWITSRLKQELVTQVKGVAQGDEIEAQRDPQVASALDALMHPVVARR